MSSLAAFAIAFRAETISAGTQLTTEGTRSGQLYILEKGRLNVAREGVVLATIDEPGAIVGEMAVLLGTPHSATVTADIESVVRVVPDAVNAMSRDADFAMHVATLACARLDATSALLVELKTNAKEGREQALMGRIMSALSAVPRLVGRPSKPAHE